MAAECTCICCLIKTCCTANTQYTNTLCVQMFYVRFRKCMVNTTCLLCLFSPPLLSYPHPHLPPVLILTSPLSSPSPPPCPHPSSPVLTPPPLSSPLLPCPHPSSPVLTPPPLSSPLLPCPHPSSPVLTPPPLSSPLLPCPHPSSPVLTPPPLSSSSPLLLLRRPDTM